MSVYDQEWYVKAKLEFRKRVKIIKKRARQGAVGMNERSFAMCNAYVSCFQSYPRRIRSA